MAFRNPRLVLGAAALFAVAGWSAASWAADAADDTLEEVVVTAEKRSTNLQKTAVSIQVYSGEELKKTGKKRIDEIMSGVVGVQTQGSQVGTSFYMRGVESGGGGPPGGGLTQTTVAVLIDGVYQNRSETVRGGSLDVSQVEVMRGTQSTSLGASALAGAVSLVSNQPVFEYQANGSVEIGNYNLLDTEGVLNIPLASNQAIRFAYSTDKRDGYLASGAGDSDLTNARLKYRWQVSDSLDIVLTGNHQKIGGNGVSDGVLLYSGHWEPYTGQVALTGCAPPTGTTTMGCPASYIVVDDGVTYKDRSNPWDDGFPANAWPNNPYRDTTIDSYSSDVNWDTGIGKLTITPSIQHSQFLSTEPPRGTSFREQDQTQDTRQLDARLASADNSKLTWLGGLYYYYTNQAGTFDTVLFPGANDMGVVCPDTTTTASTTYSTYCHTWSDTAYSNQETLSAYGNATWSLLDTLRLIGGVRYSHDRKAADSSADDPGTVAGPSSDYLFTSGSASWSSLTYRVGAEYDLLPQSMLYATFQTGYEPGALNVDTTARTTSSTAKQGLDQITLGIKNRFFDNRLQLNVEAFHSLFHDRPFQGNQSLALTTNDTSCQVPPGSSTAVAVLTDTTGCVNFPATATVPNVLSQGVDLDSNWLITSKDRLDFSAEYLQSIYKDAPALPSLTEASLLALAGQSGTTDASILANADAVVAAWNGQLASYQGLTMQNSPRWTLNATYSHTFSLPGGSSLVPSVNAIYKTRYWTIGGSPNVNVANPGLAYQEAYSLYNASMTWTNADGKFNVSANIKNIQNKPIMTNYGTEYVTLDAPRTFSIQLSASL